MASLLRGSRRRISALVAGCLGLFGVGALAIGWPSNAAYAAGTATINGARTFQKVDGFGVSEAFGQASAVMQAPPAEQQQILDLLYSPTRGAGLTILRNEISAAPQGTIEPVSPGSPAATPAYRSLAQTNQDSGQLWFAQQIRARYGVTNVFADAWSAPGFMKTNGSPTDGGTLCGVPGAYCPSGDWRQAYADYLVQYARDYAAAGVPLTYLGPENEANLVTTYDSMLLTPAQTANVMDVLGPTLARSGLPTQAECCAAEGWNLAQQYAAAIETDPTANAYTKVFGSHGYTQAPTTPLSGWTKPAWQTEWFGTSVPWDAAWDDGTPNSGFTWAQNIQNGLTQANLSAFLFWWGTNVLSPANTSLLMLDSNGTVLQSARLWAFAGFSRFIRPGAVRIQATTSDPAVELSAFRNSDGSLAIVALNTSGSAKPIDYALTGTTTSDGATVTPYLTNAAANTAAQAATTVRGNGFTATVPARALVTYVIPAHSATGGSTTPPTGATTTCRASFTKLYNAPVFSGMVTIRNTGTVPVTGWTVTFSLPGTRQLYGWGADVTRSGTTVTARDLGFNRTIPPGGTVTFAILGSPPTATTPSDFTLNATPCTP